MGLEWFGQHYTDNAFFFKADTDVIIDIFKIIRLINDYDYKWNESNNVFGLVNRKGKVRRNDETDDWSVSYEIYPNNTFPPYAIGKKRNCWEIHYKSVPKCSQQMGTLFNILSRPTLCVYPVLYHGK